MNAPPMRTPTLRPLAAAAALLAAGACADGLSTPGGDDLAPTLMSIAPEAASPLTSPTRATLLGSRLTGATLSAPVGMFADPLAVHDDSIELRISHRGVPAGTYWITVETRFGRDSIPFTVSALEPGEVLAEGRALWVSRFEYTAPSDIDRIMERAAFAGFNLVYFQVRGRADAFYSSSIEPWSHMLTGTLGEDPGWDPLGRAVEEARRHGVEIHAWINAFTGWAGATPPTESQPRHAFLEHPDWVMVDEDGTPMPYASGSRWLTPGHPGVRTRLAAVAADIARRYDVDGIHLDFIRYPDTRHSYDEASMAAYDSVRAEEPALTFAEMRRRFVTWSVAEARDSLKVVDPSGVLSAAVWGIYRNDLGWSSVTAGYDDVLQDPRAWDRSGLVDVLAPMVYWTLGDDYGDRLDFAYLADEHALAIEAPTYIGIYVPPLDRADLATQIERARLAGAEGVSVFSYTSVDDLDAWSALRGAAFYWPAAPPGP